MEKPIEHVVISVFDVHVFKPFTDGAALSASYKFLIDDDAYRRTQVEKYVIDLPDFRLYSLKPKLRDSYFWQQFAEARPETSGISELLLPFCCRPKSFDCTVTLPPAGSSRVRTRIWLWSFGWSSIVQFSFHAALDFDELREIAETLRVAQPFTIANTPASLSQIFKNLSNVLKRDISPSSTQDLKTSLRVPRYTTIAAFPPKTHPRMRYSGSPGGKKWSDAARARIHGVLLARYVAPEEVIARENSREYLLTNFGGGSVGLSDFARHSSFFILRPRVHLTHLAHWHEPLRCVTSNLVNCSLVGLALAEFVLRPDTGNATGKATELSNAATKTLRNLPKYYSNPFCDNFFENHKLIKKASEEGLCC